jgi:hypothetical protein
MRPPTLAARSLLVLSDCERIILDAPTLVNDETPTMERTS